MQLENVLSQTARRPILACALDECFVVQTVNILQKRREVNFPLQPWLFGDYLRNNPGDVAIMKQRGQGEMRWIGLRISDRRVPKVRTKPTDKECNENERG